MHPTAQKVKYNISKMQNTVQPVLRGKFTAFNASMRKEEKCPINHLNTPPQQSKKKQEENNPKQTNKNNQTKCNHTEDRKIREAMNQRANFLEKSIKEQ